VKAACCRECPIAAAGSPTGQGIGDLKKGHSVLCEKPEVNYSFMYDNTGSFSITVFSAALGVSLACYYNKGRSGASGPTLDLADGGHCYNRKTVAASM